MTVEDFYKEQNYPELDKHDKKASRFTYYDMLEFASNYKDKRQAKVTTVDVIIRLIASPFFACLALIGGLVLAGKFIYHYVRYGGEAISYVNNDAKKTIGDVYRKVENQS